MRENMAATAKSAAALRAAAGFSWGVRGMIGFIVGRIVPGKKRM